jgi:hypothetical protein
VLLSLGRAGAVYKGIRPDRQVRRAAASAFQ